MRLTASAAIAALAIAAAPAGAQITDAEARTVLETWEGVWYGVGNSGMQRLDHELHTEILAPGHARFDASTGDSREVWIEDGAVVFEEEEGERVADVAEFYREGFGWRLVMVSEVSAPTGQTATARETWRYDGDGLRAQMEIQRPGSPGQYMQIMDIRYAREDQPTSGGSD